jgi:hypothetical protein
MRDKVKQKAYIKERVKGKSIRKAAKAADVPVRTAARAEKDPEIRSAMARALDRVGATDDKIAQVVYRNLDAKKVLPPGEDGKSKKVDDGQVQLKAAELAGKFRGDFIDKQEVEHKGTVTMAVEVMDFSKLVKAKKNAASGS